jgi:hypothetical protein
MADVPIVGCKFVRCSSNGYVGYVVFNYDRKEDWVKEPPSEFSHTAGSAGGAAAARGGTASITCMGNNEERRAFVRCENGLHAGYFIGAEGGYEWVVKGKEPPIEFPPAATAESAAVESGGGSNSGFFSAGLCLRNDDLPKEYHLKENEDVWRVDSSTALVKQGKSVEIWLRLHLNLDVYVLKSLKTNNALYTIQHEPDAHIHTGSWVTRSGDKRIAHRLDDVGNLTTAGQELLERLAQCGDDQQGPLLSVELLACKGGKKCVRGCGGIGECVADCGKGQTDPRHHCTLRIQLTRHAAEGAKGIVSVKITGEHNAENDPGESRRGCCSDGRETTPCPLTAGFAFHRLRTLMFGR